MARNKGRKRRDRYVERTKDDYKNHEKSYESGSKGFSFINIPSEADIGTYSVREGRNKVRISDPTFDFKKLNVDNHFGLPIWVHFNVGSGNGAFLCLNKNSKLSPDDNDECPICAEYKEVIQEYDNMSEKERNAARKLKPTLRFMMYVNDCLAEDDNERLLLWLAAKTADEGCCDAAVDPDTGEILHIDDPDNGRPVIFKFVKGKNTKDGFAKYKNFSAGRDETRFPDEAFELAADHPLNTLLVFKTYEELETIFNGRVEDSDDDIEEEKSSKRKSKKEEKKSSPKIDYEDVMDMSDVEIGEVLMDECEYDLDEVDEMDRDELIKTICDKLLIDTPDDEDDDEEEVKPKRKAKRKKKKKVDNDKDEDDEEQKEKLKKRFSKRRKK